MSFTPDIDPPIEHQLLDVVLGRLSELHGPGDDEGEAVATHHQEELVGWLDGELGLMPMEIELIMNDRFDDVSMRALELMADDFELDEQLLIALARDHASIEVLRHACQTALDRELEEDPECMVCTELSHQLAGVIDVDQLRRCGKDILVHRRAPRVRPLDDDLGLELAQIWPTLTRSARLRVLAAAHQEGEVAIGLRSIDPDYIALVWIQEGLTPLGREILEAMAAHGWKYNTQARAQLGDRAVSEPAAHAALRSGLALACDLLQMPNEPSIITRARRGSGHLLQVQGPWRVFLQRAMDRTR